LMQPRALFNPFPGLRPFEADEDHLFFGREKEIDELLRRLRSSRFLSVIGTSGSGKSSLVRSGLIPSLYSGFMVKAGSTWRVSTLRPGEDPIGHLAASLNAPDVLGTKGELASTNQVLLEATLRRGTLGLVEAVRQARIPPYDNLLVVVDQFEELFRFRRSRQIENSRDEAVAFVKLLLEATQQDDVPIYVVLTMRSDFIGDCMEYSGLPEAVNAGQYLVPRMTRDELRSAITGPVAVGGGEIAPRLVLRLLNDVGDGHDQLPVLQHALMRTWDHWEQHRQPGEAIDMADYEAVGTLGQALSLHAEEAYQETGSDRGRKIAERLFKALTDTFSDQRGVRHPTSVQELAAICEAAEPEVIQIIDVFRHPGRCFLMPPASTPLESRSIIDLSHESLMRCWTRLIAWAEEERVSADAYARLSKAASWFEEGTVGLWRNPELELGLRWRRQNRPTAAWAQRYDASFVRAMEFLDRSEKERDRVEAERENERKRKLRHAQWVAGILGTLLMVAVSLAYLVWREKGRAEANLQLAKNAVDESLSSAGRQQAREAADVPEMEEFRQDLLRKAKDFYVNYLTKRQPDNEKFRNEMAWAHSRLGDINRLLEKHEDAVNEYEAAMAQFESLTSQHPSKPEYRQALAYSYNWLGETLRLWLEETQSPSRYTRADAEKAYDSALRLQQDLFHENSGNAKYRQELARTYYNRGILRADSKLLDDSDSDFRKAIGLLEPLVEKNTESLEERKTDPTPSQDLARVYNNLGYLLRREHKLPEAREFYERAVGIHERLMEREPENRECKQELAKFYDNLAALLLEQFDLARQRNQQAHDLIDLAKRRNHQALDLVEELVFSPGRSLGMELAKAHILRGRILESQGSREAKMESERSLDILGKLEKTHGSREHPEFHVLYMQLGYSFRDLAQESLESGSLADAQQALENLSRLLPELSEPDRSTLGKSYEELQRELHRKKMAKRK
jgi:tetratricopeptide (TPR) repeat protein